MPTVEVPIAALIVILFLALVCCVRWLVDIVTYFVEAHRQRRLNTETVVRIENTVAVTADKITELENILGNKKGTL